MRMTPFIATAIAAFAAPSCTSERAGDPQLSSVSNAAIQTTDGPLTDAAPQNQSATDPMPTEAEIANLPYARGKTFASLDEYLAHLEKNGEIDLPYWREIGPGLYEWVVRMPEAERKTATRDELLTLYGFNR